MNGKVFWVSSLSTSLTIDPLIEVLEQGLSRCAAVENGEKVNGDAAESGNNRDSKAETCRSLLMMTLRIPLAPLSLHHQNQIFSRLVRLDDAIYEGKSGVCTNENEKIYLLTMTRCGIARFLQTVAKSAIEASAMVDGFISLFTSLNQYASDDLREITLRCGEILLRRFATSESSRVAEVLKHLINKTVATSLYKLQSLRAQLRTWLASAETEPFYPDGESLLGITVLAELNVIKDKFDESILKKFEMMRFDTLVQLRDSLAELLNGDNLDDGVSQATYLLESLRRLLEDDKTQMDLKGLHRYTGADIRIIKSMWACACFLLETVMLDGRLREGIGQTAYTRNVSDHVLEKSLRYAAGAIRGFHLTREMWFLDSPDSSRL